MVVVGYRPDDSVYVNDPNFWGEFRQDGDHHVYTSEEFFAFWRNENNREKNPPNIAFAVLPKTDESVEKVDENKDTQLTDKSDANPVITMFGDPVIGVVSAEIGVRARTSPSVEAVNILTKFTRGTKLDIIGSVKGSKVGENDTWYLVKADKPLYVWSGAIDLMAIPSEAKANDIENVVPAQEPINLSGMSILNTEDYDQYIQSVKSIYMISKSILEKHEQDLKLKNTGNKTSLWDNLIKYLKK